MPNAKAQASTELLMILGISLLCILFFAIFASSTMIDVQRQKELHDADQSVQRLAEAADYVLAQGNGASLAVSVVLPPSTNIDPQKTYVGKPSGASASISSNRININVGGNDVSAYSGALLAGSFPNASGTYNLNVTSHGTFVNIGDEMVSASPSRLHTTMFRSQTGFFYLTFTSRDSQPVFVNISTSWSGYGPSLSIYPREFVLYGGTSVVRLNFTTDIYDGGIYSGYLAVNARSTASPATQMNFTIPISVRVQEQ